MFVTINTKKRYPYFYDTAFAREAVEGLYRTQLVHPFFLFGFVVMPDHCHFLVNVPSPETIAMVIKSYKNSVTSSVARGGLWQGRYYVVFPKNSWRILDYLHQNPVKAQLCDAAESYPWSSASGLWDVTPLPSLWLAARQ
jgi:REP element-mobilizing transposase RayT